MACLVRRLHATYRTTEPKKRGHRYPLIRRANFGVCRAMRNEVMTRKSCTEPHMASAEGSQMRRFRRSIGQNDRIASTTRIGNREFRTPKITLGPIRSVPYKNTGTPHTPK